MAGEHLIRSIYDTSMCAWFSGSPRLNYLCLYSIF